MARLEQGKQARKIAGALLIAEAIQVRARERQRGRYDSEPSSGLKVIEKELKNLRASKHLRLTAGRDSRHFIIQGQLNYQNVRVVYQQVPGFPDVARGKIGNSIIYHQEDAEGVTALIPTIGDREHLAALILNGGNHRLIRRIGQTS